MRVHADGGGESTLAGGPRGAHAIEDVVAVKRRARGIPAATMMMIVVVVVVVVVGSGVVEGEGSGAARDGEGALLVGEEVVVALRDGEGREGRGEGEGDRSEGRTRHPRGGGSIRAGVVGDAEDASSGVPARVPTRRVLSAFRRRRRSRRRGWTSAPSRAASEPRSQRRSSGSNRTPRAMTLVVDPRPQERTRTRAGDASRAITI